MSDVAELLMDDVATISPNRRRVAGLLVGSPEWALLGSAGHRCANCGHACGSTDHHMACCGVAHSRLSACTGHPCAACRPEPEPEQLELFVIGGEQ